MTDKMDWDNRRNSQPGSRLQVIIGSADNVERRGSDSIVACASSKASKKYYELKALNANGAEKAVLLENGAVKISILQPIPQNVIDPKMPSEKKRRPPKEETFWSIALEVLFPFLVAGMGMVGAGLVLQVVQVPYCLISSLLVVS